MPDPVVSVIIPTYNRRHTLSRALNSVLSQSYPDFEVIVVDDASTDGTLEMLGAYTDSRIRVVRHAHNVGGSAARNTGMREARGMYAAFLDSDDEWLPTKLEKQVALFSRLPAEVGLVYTGAIILYPNGEKRYGAPRFRGDIFRRLLISNVITGSCSAAMIRRQVFDQVGGFDEALPAMQDIDYWVRVAREFKVDYVPEPLVLVHSSDDTSRISKNKPAVLTARRMFAEKYAKVEAELGLQHISYIRTGATTQFAMRDHRAARRWYLKAIRSKPLDATGYWFFLSTFVPLKLRRFIGRCLSGRR